MEICRSGHEEVCFCATYCPLCDLLGDLEDLEADLLVKVEIISELGDQIADLEGVLEDGE